MIPEPQTVKELFKGHPERWTRKAFARNPADIEVLSDSSSAVKWCLGGACLKVYGLDKACLIFGQIRGYTNFPTVGKYNDNPKTTFEDIMKVVEELNI